jgi:translocation and assembly module TamA
MAGREQGAHGGWMAGLVCLFVLLAGQGSAEVRLDVRGGDRALTADLRAASLLAAPGGTEALDAHEVLASASADYARLVDILYRHGHYGGTVSIRLDGREADSVSALALPDVFRDVDIRVDPGPLFRFGTVRIAPLADGTELPPAFAPGATALSGVIVEAVGVALAAWREAGRAVAAPVAQSIVANHGAATLDVVIRLDPGPAVRFGTLRLVGDSAVRPARIRAIAALPEGALFTPSELDRSARRLRRTEAFSSVTLTGSGRIAGDGTMDVDLAVTDQKPRRFGLGAELSPGEGGTLSGFWLHRNLLGGAERFRIDAEIVNIGGQTGGVDAVLGLRLGVPAILGGDTNGYASAEISHLDEPDFRANRAAFGLGVDRILSDRLQVSAGLGLSYAATTDSFGTRMFRLATLPVSATWDRRDDRLDAVRGSYAAMEAKPFYDLGAGATGLRLQADARTYRTVGGLGLAARVQAGTVVGTALTATPPDFLFYSGGATTVRGQPYQSLAVDLGGGLSAGGRSFLALSAELRADVAGPFGAVVFADMGYVGPESFYNGSGAWHAGMGLGLRYMTGVGPIRLDLAVPVAGTTGAGLQLYLGIGQAF